MGQRGGEGPAGTRLGPESAHAVAGLGAGVLASVLVAPLDLLKTRLQVQRRGHAKYSRGIHRARPTVAPSPPPSPQLSPSATPAPLLPDLKRCWPRQHLTREGGKNLAGVVAVWCGACRFAVAHCAGGRLPRALQGSRPDSYCSSSELGDLLLVL